MEDVLEVYTRPADPRRPVICLDETSKQLVGETRIPLPAQPRQGQRRGQPERFDYEYERRGVCNLFMLFEPLAGKRWVKITERRTRCDFAECLRELIDERYPEAEQIVLVLDNLNTHTPGSLYEAFPPAEARRLAEKLEIHYTPKHGSWLNMAEIELSVCSRQCLNRRIPEPELLAEELAAWEAERNAAAARMQWRFDTGTARQKLKRLYPSLKT